MKQLFITVEKGPYDFESELCKFYKEGYEIASNLVVTFDSDGTTMMYIVIMKLRPEFISDAYKT